jgi:hypothetical protein
MTMTAQEDRAKCQLAVAGVDMGVILDPKPELCFMRYELTDYEWACGPLRGFITKISALPLCHLFRSE